MLRQIPLMQNAQMAYHLTLTLDGWSNARMESIYSWNVIFPTRKVMLLKAQDLSAVVHSGDNLSGNALYISAVEMPLHQVSATYLPFRTNSIHCFAVEVIKELRKWGPEKFAAIVTDNAKNMIRTRMLVLREFPHLIEIRYVLDCNC